MRSTALPVPLIFAITAVTLFAAASAQFRSAVAQAPVAAAPASQDLAAKAELEAKTRLRLTADWQLAQWLVAETEVRRQLLQAAVARLDDGDAKQLAEQSASDAAQLLAELRPFTDLKDEAERATDKLLIEPAEKAGAVRPNAAAANAQAAGDPPAATVDVPTGNPAAPVVPVPTTPAPTAAVGGDGGTGAVIVAKIEGAGFDMVGLKRDLAKQSLASAEAYFQAKQGADLAAALLAYLEAAQSRELDTLKVFRRHASPQLQAVIDEAVERGDARSERLQRLVER